MAANDDVTPDEHLRLFHACAADYHRLLTAASEGDDVKRGQLEDAAAEAMCHALDLFEHLAKGGLPPFWDQSASQG